MILGLSLMVGLTSGPVPWETAPRAHAVDSNGHLTDEELFGVWNSGSSSWSSAGKINYQYAGGLDAVETAVKQGDYVLAKSELLSYYQSREGISAFPLLANNPFNADLIADQFYWRAGGTALPQAEFTVEDTYREVSIDLTGHVRGVKASGGLEVSYLLMGRDKDDLAAAEFNSRENSAHPPVLELVAGSQTRQLEAYKDTYVYAGTPGQTFGSAPLMYVQDSGIAANAALDANSRRSYLSFQIPGDLTGEITSARLKLYGKASGAETMRILVVSNTLGYTENTLAWSNMSADIYSFQGLPGGNDWINPAGAHTEYYMINSRFQFFGDLVGTYAATGNESYAESAIQIMLDFMGMPDAYLFSSTPGKSRSIDVSFRSILIPRLMNHLLASLHFDEEILTEILKNIWQTQNWLNNDPAAQGGGNWGLLEARSVYAAALYFPEFADSQMWIDTQKRRIDSQIASLVYLDGGYNEASYNYSQVALQSFYDFVKLGDLYGDEMTPSFSNNIAKLARYMLDFTLPNGYSPVYGDGGYNNGHLSAFEQMADRFGDEELKYVATQGAEGIEPAHTTSYYPDTNHVIMRTGWDQEDKYLHYNLSTGGHGHMDQNAVIAYAYGKVLLTDTGVNDYNYLNPVSKWQFDSAASHNTIQIDERDQHKYNNNSAAVQDTMDHFLTNSQFDYSEGTTYSTAGFEHTRSVLFVKPNYWIVSDSIHSDTVPGEHSYKQNWHTLPGANPVLDPVSGKMSTNFQGAANIQVIPLNPSSLSSAVLNDGYYDQTTAPNTKYATYMKTSTGPVTFDTVLYPTAAGETRSISAAAIPLLPADPLSTAMRIDLDDAGKTAVYYNSRNGSADTARSFDDLEFNGKLAYVEKGADQSVMSVSLYGGTSLKQGNTLTINSKDPLGDLAVAWEGTTLEITGSQLTADTDSGTAIAILAPGVTEVLVNGRPQSFSSEGNYIFAVRTGAEEYDFQRDFGELTGSSGWKYETADTPPQPYSYASAGVGGWDFGTDNFNSASMKGQWQVVHQDRGHWTVTEEAGKLRIKTQGGDIWGASTGQKNLILQTPFHPDYIAETKLHFNPGQDYQAAGIILYANDDYYLKFERAFHSGQGGQVIRMVKEFQNSPSSVYRVNEPYVSDPFAGSDLYLRLTKTGLVLKAEYSGNGTDWTQLGPLIQIPSDTMKLGLQAMNTKAEQGQPLDADFDYFNVTQLLPNRQAENTTAGSAIVAKEYMIPGTGKDAIQKWVAPSSGYVHVAATVSSQNAFTSGDNFQVKVLKNTANVWPVAGWQVIERSDTTGKGISKMIEVEKGDVLSFVTNRIANAQNDVAKWDIKIMLYPEGELLASGFESGNATGWLPLNDSRWSVDLSEQAYTLQATGFPAQAGGRPGEYSLWEDSNAERFKLSLQLKLKDDLVSVPDANAVVLFNYVDADHYYYLQLDNDPLHNRIYKVVDGEAKVIADSNAQDHIKDNLYHQVVIERSEAEGSIVVYLDNKVIIRAHDKEITGGQIGVGSMTGSAAFRELGLIPLNPL